MTKLAGIADPPAGVKKPEASLLEFEERFERLTRYEFPAESLTVKNPVVGS